MIRSYGLNAAIYTLDINKAIHAAKRLEAGGIIVNDIPTFRVDHMPYGGVKEVDMAVNQVCSSGDDRT